MNMWKCFSAGNPMFHVEHGMLLGIFLVFAGKANAQTFQPGTIKQQEVQVFKYINQLRQDPRRFFNQFIIPYADSDRRIDRSYIRSLRAIVNQLNTLPPLTVSQTMEKTARFMSRDLARFNGRKLSHTSSGGLTFEERMKNAGVDCAGENLYSGIDRTPLQMVMDLLIDWRVPSLGHRKNLLNPRYTSIGIAIGRFGQGGEILVTDFSCR
ncbi:MAG TPA: CAP domain-containing protein [Chitinophagaceae bacterium]|nr:CAP domain-containing protein [Chitinophagaceae bacterium]